METFEDRLNRFLAGSPNEVFFTILNSISNFTLLELRAASDAGLHQLTLLAAHSVMQTIGEQIYGKTGLEGTGFYLRNFVDGETADTKFSEIASELHTYRNVHAHRWSSRFSHSVGLDTSGDSGWWRDDRGLHINPNVFMNHFAAGFRAYGPMWTLPRQLDALTALKRKYRFLRQWLELDKGNTISTEIRTLDECTDLHAARQQEAVVRRSIAGQFGLDGAA